MIGKNPTPDYPRPEPVFNRYLNKFQDLSEENLYIGTKIIFDEAAFEEQSSDYELSLIILEQKKKKLVKWIIRCILMILVVFAAEPSFLNFFILMLLFLILAIFACFYSINNLALSKLKVPIICQYAEKRKDKKLLSVQIVNDYLQLNLATETGAVLEPLIIRGFTVIPKADLEQHIVDLANGIIYKKLYTVRTRKYNCSSELYLNNNNIQKGLEKYVYNAKTD